jgi:hypothetical protein
VFLQLRLPSQLPPMRPFAPQVVRFTNRSTSSSPALQLAASYFTSGYQSTSTPTQQFRNMSSSTTDVGELKLESTVKTAPGVDLSSEQKTLVSSVLDLFAGRPSLAKLQLWKDDAVFSDPITVAKGRKEFEPQWVCDPVPAGSEIFISNKRSTVRPPVRLLRDRAQIPQRYLIRQPHPDGHDHLLQSQGHRQRDHHQQQGQHLPRERQDHPRRGQVGRQPP